MTKLPTLCFAFIFAFLLPMIATHYAGEIVTWRCYAHPPIEIQNWLLLFAAGSLLSILYVAVCQMVGLMMSCSPLFLLPICIVPILFFQMMLSAFGVDLLISDYGCNYTKTIFDATTGIVVGELFEVVVLLGFLLLHCGE